MSENQSFVSETTSQKSVWITRAEIELPNAQYYIDNFTEEQLKVLLAANDRGHNISAFADPRQTPAQLRYIYKAAERGEDVTYYINNTSFDPKILEEMRVELVAQEFKEMIKADTLKEKGGSAALEDLIGSAEKVRNTHPDRVTKDKAKDKNTDLEK